MKQLIFTLLFLPLQLVAQEKDWHHLDPEDDGILGISTVKAYDYLKDKKADTVIIAIIDNGAQITHEDLAGTIWVNPKEIPNNKIDDDNNGYIDDINGWNFLGNSKGENLKRETVGITRLYALLHEKYVDQTQFSIQAENLEEYKRYQFIKSEFEATLKKKNEEIIYYQNILAYYIECDATISDFLKKSDYTEDEVRQIKKRNHKIASAKHFLIQIYDNKLTKKGIETRITNLKKDLETRLNPKYKNREHIVGDDPDNMLDTLYGNNNVQAKGPYHGTGVASVVGALNNTIGVDGVAKHVKLMIIRIVPNGDERDKDTVLAWKYAINNGADIINCSFGKKHSVHPEFVRQAIIEAEQAGVLIVNGAGNLGTNNDEIPYYPTGLKTDSVKANNFITVGASKSKDNEHLAAFFSNYGETSVDIFAPGFNIGNCVLNNGYDKGSGTSISAPVVAGMAAVLKSYYPYLTAKQLKEIIIKSAYIPKTERVISPGENRKDIVSFKTLSVAGGIANLYRAVLLVEKEYKP